MDDEHEYYREDEFANTPVGNGLTYSDTSPLDGDSYEVSSVLGLDGKPFCAYLYTKPQMGFVMKPTKSSHLKHRTDTKDSK